VTAARAEVLSLARADMLREPSNDAVPLAVNALALYAFVVISRVTELVPPLHLGLVCAALAIALALLRPLSPGPGIFQAPEVRGVIALFALAIATIPLSVWPGGSFAHVTNVYVKVVILFLITVHVVRSARDAHRVIWALLAAVLTLELRLRPWGGPERATVSAMYDANDLAFVMICSLPLAASLFTTEKGGLRRAVAGLVALLAVLSIVRSGSRGGFLGLTAIGTVLLIRLPWRPGARAALVVGSLVIFGLFASEAYWTRISTIWGGEAGVTNQYDAGGITAARWNIWKTALLLFLNNPLIGVGAGAFTVAEGYSHGGAGKWSTAHNSFLQIAAELGVGGLILFVVVLYHALASCREVARWEGHSPGQPALQPLARGLEIGLYSYLVTGFALSQAYSALLYLLLGLAVALKRICSASQHAGDAGVVEVGEGRERFAK
jgi:O-antigen ligase